MPVNLLAPLRERYGPAALAEARREAEARGFTLAVADPRDEQLAAWIDLHFAPSWWSSEVRAGQAWVARRGAEPVGFAAYDVRGFAYPWLRGIASRSDVGVFGPYGVAPAFRGSGAGEALLTAALSSLAQHYAAALIPAVDANGLAAMYARRTGAEVAERFEDGYAASRRRAIVLASGGGTNAQAVIDGVAAGRLPLELVGVVTNDAQAKVRERARRAGIAESAVVWERAVESRTAFDDRVIDAVRAHAPELVLLLGWMHLLPARFLETFPETINVHPAFLPFDPRDDAVRMPDGTTVPAFRGARAPEQTIASGARWSGVSVHQVTPAVDRGAILVRTPFALNDATTLDALRAHIRPLEHAAVAAAIRRWSFTR